MDSSAIEWRPRHALGWARVAARFELSDLVMGRFQALAERVAAEWASVGGTDTALSGLAVAALKREFDAGLEWADVMGACAGELPPQFRPGSKFGQPPVTLGRAGELLVEAYFWREPATGIHDHGFDGAFAVVTGRGVESLLKFEPEEDWSAVTLGRLTTTVCHVLEPGDVRPIVAHEVVHQVAHLSQPTLTLVVRSIRNQTRGYTRGFFAPGLAVTAPVELPEADKVRLRLVDLLARTPEANEGELKSIFQGATDHARFWYALGAAARKVGPQELNSWIGYRPWLARFEELCVLQRGIVDVSFVEGTELDFWIRSSLELPGGLRTGLEVATELATPEAISELLCTGLVWQGRAVRMAGAAAAMIRFLVKGYDATAMIRAVASEFEVPEVEVAADWQRLEVALTNVTPLRRLVSG